MEMEPFNEKTRPNSNSNNKIEAIPTIGKTHYSHTLFFVVLPYILVPLYQEKPTNCLKPKAKCTVKKRACINYLTHIEKKRIEAICGDEELCVDVM